MTAPDAAPDAAPRATAVPPPGSLVALTGATGFLGSHIADALLAGGWRVRAAVRPTSDRRWLARLPVETVTLTWREGSPAVDAFVGGAAAVVHCAGVVRAPDEAAYQRGNVETTRLLLAAAARAGGVGAFVLVSSLAAAGPSPVDAPLREDAAPAPVSAYGRSKLAAEEAAAAGWPFRTACLRPPALYGPRDAAFLPLFQAARRGWSPRLTGGLANLSLVDGRDAAAAAVALLASPAACGPYFVDAGRPYDWDDLARALGTAWGRRVRTARVPVAALNGLARLLGPRLSARLPLLHAERLATLGVAAWSCRADRLRADTGWRPERDLERGFRETLAWYRDAGWL